MGLKHKGCAPDCLSECCGFESRQSREFHILANAGAEYIGLASSILALSANYCGRELSPILSPNVVLRRMPEGTTFGFEGCRFDSCRFENLKRSSTDRASNARQGCCFSKNLSSLFVLILGECQSEYIAVVDSTVIADSRLSESGFDFRHLVSL